MTLHQALDTNDDADVDDIPRRHRQRLDSLPRVRREMARIYLDAKRGDRNTQDASRLANILALIGRLIEGSELEGRIAALEQARQQR
jgi:hypothetical protein